MLIRILIITLYLINIIYTYLLSRSYHYNSLLFTLLSLVLPIITPIILIILDEKKAPEGYTYLKALDVCWLRMETETNKMIINVTFSGKGKLSFEKYKKRMMEAFKKYDRYCCIVTKLNGYYAFKKVELDENYHFELINYDESEETLSKYFSQNLDYNYPLWKFYIMQNDDEFKVIYRTHHCLGDGLSQLRLIMEVSKEINKEDNLGFQVEEEQLIPKLSKEEIAKLASHAMKKETRPYVIEYLLQLILIPYHCLRQIFRSKDKTSILKRKPTGKVNVSWKVIDTLENVKEVAKNYGGNLNTLLLTNMSEAFQKLFIRNNTEGNNLKYYIAANMRRFEEKASLGNEIGLLLVHLPTNEMNKKERFNNVKKYFDQAKYSMEAYCYKMTTKLVGLLPDIIEKIAIPFYGSKGTINVTTIPGPVQPVDVMGNELDTAVGFVPHFARSLIGIDFMSMFGKVFIGVSEDSSIGENPKTFLNDFYESYMGYKLNIEKKEE